MSIDPNEARGGNDRRRRAPSAVPSLDPRVNNFVDLIDVEQVGEVDLEDEVSVPSESSAERRAYAEIERMRQQREIERQQRERERQEETDRRQRERQDRHQQRDREDRLRREQEADRRERSREERRSRDARPRSRSRSPRRSRSTRPVQTPVVPAPPTTENAPPPAPPPPTAGPPERLQHPRKVLVSKEDSRNLADWLNKSVTPAELKGFAEKYPIEFEKKEFSLAPPRLDDWMSRRLKESAAHKSTEAAEKTWLSVQLKVLDIAGPLVHLHQLTKQGRPLDMEEVSENVKVALELTAALSYDINRRRRRNILNHTDPRSDYLLEDPKSFSSKQTVSSLFGKRFLDAMLKEADQDEKLSRRGPPGPAPKAASGPVTRSKSGRGGRVQFSFDSDRGGGRGRRGNGKGLRRGSG
ncbi:hypothetical protein DAPPUDRAFT_122435 [Daphnia pulex]|uniref:Uncharacterized protein n=1 Tax=Daphnia pulex TaxID=6669 RepID=E9I470_DAPPU|nr:hypothetical protein DAPPUDRAFT_122435 [Daphnia pulex]|eukprot:EFX61210.1 hypothetical protein DAPPUDRAFT_122435 [Daphnia pulex]